MSGKYDDIINLPHHVSSKYPHMSSHERAAQFAPFSALTGYDEAVREVGRKTDNRIELDEYEIERINRELQLAYELLDMKPMVKIMFFVPDKIKEGGSYRSLRDRIVKIDDYLRTVSFMCGEEVLIDNIYSLFVEREYSLGK